MVEDCCPKPQENEKLAIVFIALFGTDHFRGFLAGGPGREWEKRLTGQISLVLREACVWGLSSSSWYHVTLLSQGLLWNCSSMEHHIGRLCDFALITELACQWHLGGRLWGQVKTMIVDRRAAGVTHYPWRCLEMRNWARRLTICLLYLPSFYGRFYL